MSTLKLYSVKEDPSRIIRYIQDPLKTTAVYTKKDEAGRNFTYLRLVYNGSLNCSVENAGSEFSLVQGKYRRNIVNRALHMILGLGCTVPPYKAMDIAGRFLKLTVGSSFQCLYSVHLNVPMTHIHMVINPVSHIDGRRLRISMEDLISIRSVASLLLTFNGLEPLRELGTPRESINATALSEMRKGIVNRESLAMNCIDEAVRHSYTFSDFRFLMKEMGYELIDTGKKGYPSLKLVNEDYKLLLSRLGKAYSLESIRKRIDENALLTDQRGLGSMLSGTAPYSLITREDRIKAMKGVYGEHLRFALDIGALSRFGRDLAVLDPEKKSELIRNKDLLSKLSLLKEHSIEDERDMEKTVRMMRRELSSLRRIYRCSDHARRHASEEDIGTYDRMIFSLRERITTIRKSMRLINKIGKELPMVLEYNKKNDLKKEERTVEHEFGSS
ncbi:MAG: relaxase/mobilization nuclease domain-containing protein [Clostridia bacterium]|nr:relaxase/mobilization nuclease domain-containing protein [Clostridia bacterium]